MICCKSQALEVFAGLLFSAVHGMMVELKFQAQPSYREPQERSEYLRSGLQFLFNSKEEVKL